MKYWPLHAAWGLDQLRAAINRLTLRYEHHADLTYHEQRAYLLYAARARRWL